jgi:drug/metabolite transporter (DMT)-like permease
LIHEKRPGVWAALITVYIVWGSTYLAIRFAVESMPPFLMAAVRFLIAGGILYFWQRLRGVDRPRKIEWRSAAIIGLLLLLGGNGGVVWAEQKVPSGIAALLVGAAPLWMVGIDAFRPGGHKPNRQTVIGVLIGFWGIILLIGPAQFLQGGEQIDLAGTLVLMAAAFFWAVGSLYSRTAKLPASPLLGTGMEMLAGGAGLFLLSMVTGEWAGFDIAAVTARSWWSLFYLIVFGALIGFAAYTWLLRNAPTPLVSTYAYVNPLIAVILGTLFAQETLTIRIVIAALIIISSVFVINTSRSGKQTVEVEGVPELIE